MRPHNEHSSLVYNSVLQHNGNIPKCVSRITSNTPTSPVGSGSINDIDYALEMVKDEMKMEKKLDG